MTDVIASYYNQRTNVLHVQCPVLPRRVDVTLPDMRGRKVYRAMTHKYVPNQDYIYSYDQWRDISSAVADAMEYAHDKAIEHGAAADPLWDMDTYVNRIIAAAFPEGDSDE